LLLGRMDHRQRVEFYPRRHGLHAGEFRPGHGELGKRARDVRGRAPFGLHIRPQRAGQAEAEVFLAADQASSSPWWRRKRSSSPRAGAVARSVELVRTRLAAALDARAYVDGGDSYADVGASGARAYVTEGRAVWWNRYEWGR
jgi:hypothetical protein